MVSDQGAGDARCDVRVLERADAVPVSSACQAIAAGLKRCYRGGDADCEGKTTGAVLLRTSEYSIRYLTS